MFHPAYTTQVKSLCVVISWMTTTEKIAERFLRF